ncbi:hypothetical protein FACS1894159_04080 [Bacteroidia bacterium]|nr:hypothetical protein FACS1894159_04080 [Bacteroidia bacterium]
MTVEARLAPEGREATGRALLPFASADDALRGDVTISPYVQPLGGAWQMKVISGRDLYAFQANSDDGWSETNLPMSSAVAGNVAVLRRTFKRPFVWDDREVFLHLEGVGAPYELYVGDKRCGYNPSPGPGADFDVTRLAVEGNNTVTLVLHNDSPQESALSPRLTVEGAIHAFSQPRVRVRDVDAGATILEGSGLFNLGVIMQSHLLGPRRTEVYYELRDQAGTVVASAHRSVTLSMRQSDTVRFFARVPQVKAWSVAAPNLYTLLVKTQYEGRYGECLAMPVGFRNVEVRGGKLLINGEQIALASASFKPTGDQTVDEARLRELRGQGTNIVRLSGSASTAFYTTCDRVGILVCAQADVVARREGAIDTAGDPALEPWITDRVMTMYNASKSHPSVVMFSLGEGSANGYNLYRTYLALRRVEKVRPISFSGAGGEWNSDTSSDGSFSRLIFK